MTATDIEVTEVEELYQIFDAELPCEADKIHKGDDPASWRLRTKCCGFVILMCDNCLKQENAAVMKSRSRILCAKCEKDWGKIPSLYSFCWVVAI